MAKQSKLRYGVAEEASATAAFAYFREVVSQQDSDPGKATIQLLGAAYVVNRTAEEIDDIAQQVVGVPFVSVDLMAANVLIHAALGETAGNALESRAVGAVDSAAVTHHLRGAQLETVRLHRLGAEERALDDVPVQCLARKYGFRLPGSPY